MKCDAHLKFLKFVFYNIDASENASNVKCSDHTADIIVDVIERHEYAYVAFDKIGVSIHVYFLPHGLSREKPSVSDYDSRVSRTCDTELLKCFVK